MTDAKAKGDPRVDVITEVLLALARQDFDARAPVTDACDSVDALATGINMLAEELEGAVVSKQRLELANRELRDAQSRLMHAGKLAAIGQLVSGVVHEVTNPASWSTLALDLADKRIADTRKALGEPLVDRDAAAAALDELSGHLVRAREGLARIQFIVGDLRMFSRADRMMTELVILDDVVRATHNLLEPSLRVSATITCSLGDVPPVRGHPARLGQVVANLTVNAAQAIARRGLHGNVEIRTHVDGEVVILTVEDDGPGVPEHVRESIFDPFFTTDPQGTGLGLSLVAEIVAQHEGTVDLSSPEGGGARFCVRLPCASR